MLLVLPQERISNFSKNFWATLHMNHGKYVDLEGIFFVNQDISFSKLRATIAFLLKFWMLAK